METKKLIATIKATINKNTVLPILEYVCLKGDTLEVTDLETHVIIPFKSGVDGAIHAGRFITAMGLMENPFFEILKKEGQPDGYAIAITEGRRNIILSMERTDNFPKWVNEKYKPIGSLDANAVSSVKTALNFISKDTIRPALCGVYIGKMIVATDAHRMYYNKITPLSDSFIIPSKTARIVLAIGGTWEVYYSNERVYLTNSDGTKIYFKGVAGEFPDYKSVIPKYRKDDNTIEVTINTKALKAETVNALKFADTSSNQIVIELIGHNVKILASDIHFDHSYENDIEVIGVKNNRDFKIAFNGKYLIDILNELPETANIKLTSPRRAATFNDSFLLMPLLIGE